MSRLDYFRLVSVAALIVLPAFMAANAQMPALLYDKSSEVKVTGIVNEVKIAADNNVHLMLTSGKGSLDVMLATEKFLKEMEITFAKGDAIEVLGSQLKSAGAEILLAREVNRNGDVMTMRDEQGKPVWVGWIQ
jgi:hypothetical protein